MKATRAAGEAQKGSKLTEIFEQPDLGAQPINLSNDHTNKIEREKKKKNKNARSVNETGQRGRKGVQNEVFEAQGKIIEESLGPF